MSVIVVLTYIFQAQLSPPVPNLYNDSLTSQELPKWLYTLLLPLIYRLQSRRTLQPIIKLQD